MKKFPISMQNTYTIYKVKNGRKTQVAHCHNLVMDSLYASMCQDSSSDLHSIWFGTGTAEPQVTDTALTSPLWTFGWNYSNVIQQYRSEIAEDDSFNMKYTLKVPATETYVGTVTEMALYFTHGTNTLYMGTKALIKDAEGNPISITKTDTEELLIDVHLKLLLGSSENFKWNPYWGSICITNRAGLFGKCLPMFGNCRIKLLNAYPDAMGCGSMASVIPVISYNKSTKKLTCTNGRFTADVITSQRYINAIGITVPHSISSYEYYLPIYLSGWWKFPNVNIFPQRTLSNMSVGVGDGNTKEFKPPLNMWVKDTEKIYVDGILLTRGTDYTCDHRNNLDVLKELCPTAFSKLLNTLQYSDTSMRASTAGYHPFNGGVNALDNSDKATYTYIQWDQDHPLIWELLEDPQVGLDADYFQMNGITNTVSAYISKTSFILSYSNDLETWTEIGRYTYPNSGNAYASYKFEFEQTIAAKYWKLEVDTTNSSSDIKNGRFISREISYLGRNGSPIVFTNPPAEGAIITMDADIDRPMKNSNFIIDCNPEFQF